MNITNANFNFPYFGLIVTEFNDPLFNEIIPHLESQPSLEDGISSDQIHFLDDVPIELPVSSQKRSISWFQEDEFDFFNPKRHCLYLDPYPTEEISNFPDETLIHPLLSHLQTSSEDQTDSNFSSLEKTTLFASDHFSEISSSDNQDERTDKDNVNNKTSRQNKYYWTDEEIERLKELVELHGTKWKIIAPQLNNKSPHVCLQKWATLKSSLSSEKYRSIHNRWSNKDNERLKELVRQHGTNWKIIAPELKRSISQCTAKWSRLKPKLRDKKKYHSVCNTWSKEDVERLKELVKQHRTNWKIIAPELKRSISDCAAKWGKLKLTLPDKEKYRSVVNAWSNEDVEKLKKLVKQHGTNWKIIAPELKRSISQCQSRWIRLKKEIFHQINS